MPNMTARLYFTRADVDGPIIAIRHGETGYHDTDLNDMEAADKLNRAQGIRPAEVEAALTCSLFNKWAEFPAWVERFEFLNSPPECGPCYVTDNGHGTG